VREDVCILVSTCEKHRALADFTKGRLDASWPAHPRVYVAGLEGDGPDCLPLRDDARDWMRVTHSACRDLFDHGYRMGYVILEDHPPVGRCHANHLNETFPAMMVELGAVSVALSGYGQGRKRHGRLVRWRKFAFDLCPATELWKFPLHPALWRLETLCGILEWLIETLPEAEHTPWAFERKGGAPDAALADAWKSNSYRIEGSQFAATAYPAGLAAARLTTDAYRFLIRRLMGQAARDAIDDVLSGARHYYHGPYPLVWSGLLRKGRVNGDFHFALRLLGRDEFLGGLPEEYRFCE
jgi:hypothetical protein